MGVFPGFGGWINQNTTQQPLNADSKRSDENVKSKSASEMDPNNASAKLKVNNEKVEERKQDILWNDAEKKHPWYDPPPRIKVTTKKGLCHMNIELTLGMSPDGVYNLFTNPQNLPLFLMGNGQLLENISRKVLKNDGSRQIAELKKTVAWEFLWWSGSIPIYLIVEENKNDFTAKYKKEKMMFMKVFEGNWKVEPLYVDQERFCKHMLPKSREEYKKCSGGQGKIASKVTMDQYFEPYPPFNLPPFSWYIREITVNTTKTLLQMLQNRTVIYREVPVSSQKTTS